MQRADRTASSERRASRQRRRRGTSRGGQQTVSVTIRMPFEMVDTLKAEARRRGVRGYQTLMKQWIQERITGELAVTASQLGGVLDQLHSAERDLERLMEACDDGGR